MVFEEEKNDKDLKKEYLNLVEKPIKIAIEQKLLVGEEDEALFKTINGNHCENGKFSINLVKETIKENDNLDNNINVKDPNRTRLNVTNSNLFDISPQSDRKTINNFLPNEQTNLIYDPQFIFDENDNTTKHELKIELPNEIIQTKTKKMQNESKIINIDYLQELMQSNIINNNNNTLLVINNEQKDDFPDQNCVFSNRINYKIRNHDVKDEKDIYNITHVFVDDLIKKIRNENFDSIQPNQEEMDVLEKRIFRGEKNKNLNLNLSENILKDISDEIKI